MHSESETEGGLGEIMHSLPSILSDNRMLVAIIAFLYLLPLGTSAETSPVRALLFVMTQIMIFGLLAMSFDLQLGRAALLNFGQVALFGVGAYFMAFTLNASILPPPLNIIAIIPYPFTIILAMIVGAGIGLIMGMTTSRMRGTAFAFIALAIAMFLYNFFAENPDISGGETGLRINTPELIKTAPFYLFFVSIAFVALAAFFGMLTLYLKRRTESIGLILFIPTMAVFTGFILIFGSNVIGPAIVFVAFLGMIVFQWMERGKSQVNPMQFDEGQTVVEDAESSNMLATYAVPFIIIIALIGIFLSFGSKIGGLVSVWIEQTDTFYLIIPGQYFLVLTCLVLTYIFVRRLVVSPFGRMVVAVAQNEERAEALGYNSYYCKIVVMIISGAIAGLSGALYAPYIRTIDPETALGVGVTIDAMLYTIIGGIGTLLGPLFGAGVVVYSELNLVDFMTNVLNLPGQLWLVGLGVMYILIVLFLPLGIVGSIGRRSASIRQNLQQLRLGRFEFGLKDADYWVFALLGAMGLFLLLLEDARFLPIVIGIFGFLGVVVFFLLYTFGKEISSRIRDYMKEWRFARGGN
ncbi:MAG: branched-chain amino acid ABC transporter permease [Candidatus Thorarchaeota archaeon]